MKPFQFLSHSEAQTMQLAQTLGRHLKAGDIVCLTGDLGSGKTTFAKGIAKGLKVDPRQVNSPTFVLMNIYQGKMPLFHFDLYRMEDAEEILNLGYEEFFYDEGVTVVEWAERLQGFMPRGCLHVEMIHKGESERSIKIEAVGKRYENFKFG